jgi:hypothetical protein
MFQSKVVEKKNFMFKNFFLKVMPFMRLNVKKYDIARQATDDNIVHVHCMLDTLRLHTIRMCSTSCFSMATVVLQACINFMFICTVPVLLLLSMLLPGARIHTGYLL